MDPWSNAAVAAEDAAYARLTREKQARARLPKKITLPKAPPLPPREALATPLSTMRELAEFVAEIRTGLGIPQARLAERAGVSRQWLVALESGRPTVEAGKVLHLLEAMGFELIATPYNPPPPWMLRAVKAATEKREGAKREARVRRNGRRARAKLSRLAQNVAGDGLDLG